MAFPEQPSVTSGVVDVFAHEDLAANPVLEKVVVYLSLHFEVLCFGAALIFSGVFDERWLKQFLYQAVRRLIDTALARFENSMRPGTAFSI
jgi:hypothetical protein